MAAGLAFLLATTPGLHDWLQGRRLVPLVDDPALPERLQGARQRSTMVFATCVAILLVLFHRHWWAVPLAILGELAGAFPARRVLYGETGSFVDYVGRTSQFLVAIAGFWVILGLAPVLILASGDLAPWVSILFAAGLMLWALAEDRVALLILGVRPLDRADLEPVLAPVLARAQLMAPPTLHLLPPRGGRWANALAVSSRTRPAVVFSAALLDLLDAREAAAIYGHEIAHLEHRDAAHTTRRTAVQVALVALGVFAVPLAALAAGSFTWLVLVLWPLALVIGLFVRVARHQAHEAASDRRAIELCADPEALVSALTKLHAAARLPSRWEREMERSASHPSLARRVHAIRAEAGGAEAPSASLIVRSTEPGRFVLLEGARVSWLDGVGADVAVEPPALREAATRSRTIALGELSDLRVRAGLTSTAALVAIDRGGDSWSVPIRGEDVAPLQRALDALDHQLRPGSSSTWLHPAPAAIVALLVMIGSLLAGPMSAAMIAALVALQGSTVALAACAVAALAEAMRLAGAPGDVAAPLRGLGVVVLASAGAGGLLLTMARARHEEVRLRLRRVERTIFALAAAALLVWLIGVAALGLRPSRFFVHQLAQALPGATTLSFALAAALALWPRGLARAGAVAATVIGLLPMVAASPWFAAAVVRDPFYVTGRDVAVAARELEPVARIPLPFATIDLRLSPDATIYAARPARTVREDEEGGGPESWPSFQLGPESVAKGEIAGVDLALLDARRALVLRANAAGLEVALVELASPGEPVWRVAIADAATGSIDVDMPTRAWRFTGTTRGGIEAVSVIGNAAGGELVERRWPLGEPNAETGYETVVASPSGALVLRASFDMAGSALLMPLLGLAAIERRTEVRHWTDRGEASMPLATSGFEITCMAAWLATGDPLLCLAHDGRSTFLWAVDPADGRREPLGRLDGRHFVLGRAGEGRIVTWAEAREVAVVDLRGGAARRLAGVAGGGLVTAVAGNHLATALPGTNEIEVYDLGEALR